MGVLATGIELIGIESAREGAYIEEVCLACVLRVLYNVSSGARGDGVAMLRRFPVSDIPDILTYYVSITT